MITTAIHEADTLVQISGREADVLDVTEDYVLAECNLDNLVAETSSGFPKRLQLQIQSEDGFGTYFFHELVLSHQNDGVNLDFVCHTPNKYWEGRFGLATFLSAIRDQVPHSNNFEVTQIELDDDWKGITLRRFLGEGDPLHASILSAANDLGQILRTAEIALSGL